MSIPFKVGDKVDLLSDRGRAVQQSGLTIVELQPVADGVNNNRYFYLLDSGRVAPERLLQAAVEPK